MSGAEFIEFLKSAPDNFLNRIACIRGQADDKNFCSFYICRFFSECDLGYITLSFKKINACGISTEKFLMLFYRFCCAVVTEYMFFGNPYEL